VGCGAAQDLSPKPEHCGGRHGGFASADRKAQTVMREKIGKTVGAVEGDILVAVNRSLAVFLGIA
jgi:hypothetical protein